MYIAFDIGGTTTRIALSGHAGHIEYRAETDTNPDFNKAMEQLKFLLRNAQEKIKKSTGIDRTYERDSVVVGIAGVIERTHGGLARSPHLPGWMGKPLQKTISQICGVDEESVHLQNDAALAGLAEATAGAGKGKRIVAYITVGTGVGGARIVNGIIDKNHSGFEPGHQVIDWKNNVALEEIISGSAFLSRFNQKAQDVTDSQKWKEAEKALAAGLFNTIIHWSPDIVVLGGSMILGNPNITLSGVAEELKKYNSIFPRLPQLSVAHFKSDAGLYGALLFASQKVESDQ